MKYVITSMKRASGRNQGALHFYFIHNPCEAPLVSGTMMNFERAINILEFSSPVTIRGGGAP